MSDARAAVAWAVGVLGFWSAWVACSALKLPMFWYLPLEHRFAWAAVSPGLAICLYGQLLFAVPIGALLGGAAWAAVRTRELGRPQVWIATGWCAVLLVFVVGYFAFALWGRALG
jgi:hypothetical protein